MIAHRFRALGWVAGIASAATGLYLISLQVAAERAKLEDVDRHIASAQRDLRQLQTELGTRSSLRQLERFNSETLALAAPRAGQYLHGDVQLASLTIDGGSSSHTPPASADGAAPGPVVAAALPAIVQRIGPAEAHVEHAAFTTDRPAHRPRVAMIDRAMIDPGTLGALVQTADRERQQRP